jgi:hypothetical protein
LFVTGDRSFVFAKLMFVSSDRTWPLCERKPLTSAINLPLVVADGPEPAPAVTCREHRLRLRLLSAAQSGEHPWSLLTNEITRHLFRRCGARDGNFTIEITDASEGGRS